MNIYPSGTRIANRYEVVQGPAEKPSLAGGMGLVYLCMDHKEDRPVALKTFRPEYLPDRAARDRFLREGTTWVNLGKHPHIVRCYNIDRIGDGLEVYLALEMVAKAEGRQDASLRSWLTPGQPLPVEQALLFALQIVRGMKHATEKIPGFVHRDLKPENLLVGADRLSSLNTNRLRVTDFGLANILQVASISDQETPLDSDPQSADSNLSISRTQLTQGIVGTPLYMAPEQWMRGQMGVYTDVYTLGCILVEMLTGERAVLGNSFMTLQQAHCEGQVKKLRSLPGVVQELVEGCVQVEPGKRYQNWGELESAQGTAWEEISDRELPASEAPLQLDREERVAVGWSYSNMGASYLDIGKADVALGYFKRSQAVGQAEGERDLEAAGLIHLGNAFRNLGDARRAIGSYEKALEIIRQIGDRGGEGAALGNLGNAYADIGDARRAIDFNEQALIIFRESGDRHRIGKALGSLGNAYASLRDIHRAISSFEKYLETSREIGDKRGEGAALGGLGNAFADLEDTQRAIGYYEQRLEISREIGDRRGEGVALGNLGSAFADLGDPRRAIGYYEMALEIRREVGDIMGVAMNFYNMADEFSKLGEKRRAIELAQEAIHIFNEFGHIQYVQQAQRLIFHIQGCR